MQLLPARLGPRVFVVIVLVSAMSLCVAVGINLSISYRADRDHLAANIETLGNGVANNLALSLWRFDSEQLLVQLQALNESSEVEQATLRIADDPDGTMTVGAAVPTDRAIVREFPLVLPDSPAGDEPLGTLVLTASLAPLWAELRSNVLQSIQLQVVTTLLLAAVILWVLQLMLLRHVHTIRDFLQQMSLGTLDQDLQLQRGEVSGQDELEQIVTAINGARKRLDAEIAARLRTERRAVTAQARAESLADANRDLESYASFISHDLRAPLRTINGFIDIIREDYREQLPKEVFTHLDRIQHRSLEMAGLIDDLLALARTGRDPHKRATVDMRPLIEMAWHRVSEAHEGQSASLSIEGGPLVTGDPSLLVQVWINLMSNARKYTVEGRPVEVSAGWNGEAWYVRDNGAGFDMAQSDRLFQAFQRLHDSRQYEGTGVGLAIVRRIIERHDGKVWAEAAVGSGATFYFVLGQPVELG